MIVFFLISKGIPPVSLSYQTFAVLMQIVNIYCLVIQDTIYQLSCLGY